MANQWFKFYGGEYLSDQKMLALSGAERSCWITLLCYASQSNGVIKYLSEDQLMSVAGLKRDRQEWIESCGVLEKFQKLLMIRIDDGMITVTNWEKRQESFLTGYERTKRYRKNNTDKIKARSAVQRALVHGSLHRGVCEVCGSEDAEAHHNDYSKPLEVNWLCKDHHEDSHHDDAVMTSDKNRIDKNRREEYLTQRFDSFWLAYPNKTGKKKAFQSWLKINPESDVVAKIIIALAVAKKSKQWLKDQGQYSPHPATWLNQERWNDEGVKPTAAKSASDMTPAELRRHMQG